MQFLPSGLFNRFWRWASLCLLIGFILIPYSTGTAFSAPTQQPAQQVGQMADKRFGVVVTGSSTPATLTANLALLGNQRTWYSFDQRSAAPDDNRQRIQLVRTGVGYSSNLTALQNYARTMPIGSYWMIGNEPNVDGQDNATPAQYATQYENIKNALRQVDPTAKMVGPNMLNWDRTCSGCAGFTSGQTWTTQLLSIYQSQYGHAIDFDVWGIHTYGITWDNLPMTHYDYDISQITGLRSYLNTLPDQAGKAIWITEFGVIWGYTGYQFQNGKVAPTGTYQRQAVLNYITNFTNWLVANSAAQHVDRWYIYTSFGIAEPYATVFAGVSLLDGLNSNSQLTEQGQLYHNQSLTTGVSAPTNLSLTVVSPTQVNLSWTNTADNQTGFQLDRRSDPNGNWTPLATLGAAATSYTDSSLVGGTEYFYRAQAFNTRVNSDFSNQAVLINAPTNLSVLLSGTSEANLNWNDNSGLETNYLIERRAGNTGSWQSAGSVAANQTTFHDTGLAAGTAYFYRVRAYRSTSDSPGYSAFATSPEIVTPALPANQVTEPTDDGQGTTPGSFSYILGQIGNNPGTIGFASDITQVTFTHMPALPNNLLIVGVCTTPTGPGVTLDFSTADNRQNGWSIGPGSNLYGLILSGTTLKFNNTSGVAASVVGCSKVLAAS